MKIRKPKSEGRKKAEIRSSKVEMPTCTAPDCEPSVTISNWRNTCGPLPPPSQKISGLTLTPFGFRVSAFFRPSDFGLRISALLLSLLALQATVSAVTNLPPADALPKLRPPRGEIAPTFWEQNGLWVILGGILLLGLVAAAVWWLIRPRPAVVVPPEVVARQALEPLRRQAEDGKVLSQVSQILRRYVGAAFGLPQGEMTTNDFCRAIADQGRVGPELSASLGDFLRKCDERKFAPSAPAPALGAVEQASKLLELTEARRAQLPQPDPSHSAPQPPRAYRGASKS
jgi:hypothetical protein